MANPVRNSPQFHTENRQSLRNRILLLLSFSAVAALAALFLLYRLTSGEPSLTVLSDKSSVKPGEEITLSYRLSRLPGDRLQPISMESKLPGASGMVFVPGSLQVEFGDLGDAEVTYGNEPRLWLGNWTGEDTALRFSVRVRIPVAYDPAGLEYRPRSYVYFEGEALPAADQPLIRIYFSPFTLEKSLEMGSPAPGQALLFRVTLVNPAEGITYDGETARIDFWDEIQDPNAQIDASEVRIEGAISYREVIVNGNRLEISDLEVEAGGNVIIVYPAEISESWSPEAPLVNTAHAEVRGTLLYASASLDAGTFPVELTHFSAEADNRRAVLNWETASESNNAGFEVQHSADGMSFQALGFVKGAGTSTQPKSYAFRTQPLATGRHLFRLKQIDTDGAQQLSNTVELSLEAAAMPELKVAPNPFSTTATISLQLPQEQSITADLFDIQGRKVAALFSGRVSGQWSHTLERGSLAPGSYLIKVQGAGFYAAQQVHILP
jgi:hypothetical protein